MKKQKLQSLTVLFGAFLSLAIVCSTLFQFQDHTFAKKDVKTEKQESEHATDETISVLPSISLPSPAQVQLTIQSYCLFEIYFEQLQQEENRSSEIPLHPEKFLQTLFSVIISPNAP